MLGLVVFSLASVITAVAFLRERGQGTLERLMASPLRRAGIVLGRILGFTVLALGPSPQGLCFRLLLLPVPHVPRASPLLLLHALLSLPPPTPPLLPPH